MEDEKELRGWPYDSNDDAYFLLYLKSQHRAKTIKADKRLQDEEGEQLVFKEVKVGDLGERVFSLERNRCQTTREDIGDCCECDSPAIFRGLWCEEHFEFDPVVQSVHDKWKDYKEENDVHEELELGDYRTFGQKDARMSHTRLKAMAKELNMEDEVLCFNSKYDKNGNRKTPLEKIKEAKKLLWFTDGTISNIGKDVGLSQKVVRDIKAERIGRDILVCR